MSQAQHPLTIHYHRDFDGMVAAACLAKILTWRGEGEVRWKSVNYDQRSDWDNFERGRRFAIVDFHFHPRAEYWFDHHPTTFLTPELRAHYVPSERWRWDETSPSCPPLILHHAKTFFGFEAAERFVEMAHWSNVIDAARYRDVEEALFGDAPALRISRALTASPDPDWTDVLAGSLIDGTLEEVARRDDVERSFQRAVRNRDKALRQFPSTVVSTEGGVVHYDASSNDVRRERFAPFFHHGSARFTVGVIPTRAGYHVTAGQNPWGTVPSGVNIGAVMETHGGGGHRAVGGANARSLEDARRIAAEVAKTLREMLARGT
jgi:hypothetical protein